MLDKIYLGSGARNGDGNCEECCFVEGKVMLGQYELYGHHAINAVVTLLSINQTFTQMLVVRVYDCRSKFCRAPNITHDGNFE